MERPKTGISGKGLIPLPALTETSIFSQMDIRTEHGRTDGQTG